MSKRKNNPWHMGFIPEYAGWIPQEDRTVECEKKHRQYIFDTPVVDDVFTSPGYNKDRPAIWQVTKKAIEKGYVPDEYIRKGQFKNISQIIGSCVGFGAGNMLLWASLIDAIIRQQQERILVPFVPYHYGRGRHHSGIHGPGSGSLGSGQAEALEKDGYIAWDIKGLPEPTFADAIYWTKDIEYTWSDGARIDEKWIEKGQEHIVPTVVRVTNTEQARKLADNFYTFTIASDWGGRMKCPVKHGVLLNDRVGTWHHQMHCLHGETKIPSLDGNEYTLEELSNSKNNSVWIYAYDQKNRKVVPQKATAIKTRDNVPEGMVKVTLDNVESVVSTLDHKFMTRDGNYVEAQYLKENDSLMSFNSDNREVSSIEFLPNETGPTYCLQVPHYHNFAVSAGVFVHNCLDYITHPKLGILWWIGNQWKYPHGVDPGGPWDDDTGAPEGGFYITDRELQYILSQKDSFGFADPQGFEDRSRVFDWLMC